MWFEAIEYGHECCRKIAAVHQARWSKVAGKTEADFHSAGRQ